MRKIIPGFIEPNEAREDNIYLILEMEGDKTISARIFSNDDFNFPETLHEEGISQGNFKAYYLGLKRGNEIGVNYDSLLESLVKYNDAEVDYSNLIYYGSDLASKSFK